MTIYCDFTYPDLEKHLAELQEWAREQMRLKELDDGPYPPPA